MTNWIRSGFIRRPSLRASVLGLTLLALLLDRQQGDLAELSGIILSCLAALLFGFTAIYFAVGLMVAAGERPRAQAASAASAGRP